jgi:hypothetical protein
MVAKLFVYVKDLNYFLTLLPPFPSTHPFVRKISILINFFVFFFHSENKCNQSDSVINLSSL